jgi:2-methylcitrate dehydratase PrpD
MERSLTEQLADWIVAQRRSGFSDAVLVSAEQYTLDWLGSALAGHATEQGNILLDYAVSLPQGLCGIIGSQLCVSAENAALINGGLSHIVEMDDLDRSSITHPGCVIIPAAMAVAEQIGASGRDFLSAIVAGYEIGIRIGRSVGKQHYFCFHNTSTCGVFGAAVAAGWLLGLSAEQLVWALGNAGTMASGLWQFNADGDMSKHLHAGRAAANGVLAATLAQRGFSGARQILEGERGFFAATAPDNHAERVVSGLGADALCIDGVSIKPHASCRHTHPAIDAALVLREKVGNRPLRSIDVDTYQAAIDLCDNPDPQTGYAAKFSLYYCVAAAFVRGSVGLDAFSAETRANPTIRDLLNIIHLTHDTEFEQLYPRQWPTRIRVVTENGAELSETVWHPKGDPENRLDSAEMTAKFRQLATYGNHDADQWLDWLRELSLTDKLMLPGHR